jgi:hypothetical protein
VIKEIKELGNVKSSRLMKKAEAKAKAKEWYRIQGTWFKVKEVKEV